MDKGSLIKLITPFTILNPKLNEMDLVKNAIKNRGLETKRLHDNWGEIYKNHQFA